MCQMSVVVEDEGIETMVMENVTYLQVSGTTIEVNAFFEDPRAVEGVVIQAIDFLGGKVILKKSSV
ncbi:MAG: CooT family nickel-binding protein [Desulfocapsaceae bacterium]|nr:CooT family nickel-binding protein [Desulfocapsaceae bacterium]